MNRKSFVRLTVLFVVAFALVLQGCGGDGGDVESDLRDQIAALEGDVSAAQSAQAAAEAAQTAAEMAQAEAEAAQADAEMERDAAKVAQGVAEEAQANAEMAQADAEAAQTAAEMAQADAEAAAATAMTAQTAAETALAVSAQARMDAEAAQATAETDRDAAQTAATEAAAAQAAAETAQAAAMAAQADAEMQRDAANTARMAADEAAAMAAQAEADAQAAQAAAEADRDAVAEQLAAAQTARDMAKEAEAAAMIAQAQAEAAQASAEAQRDDAVTDQTAAEEAQAAAEAASMKAMEAQVAAEKAQAEAEAAQALAEQASMTAAQAQMDAEAERDAANTAKMMAETERDAAMDAQAEALAAQKAAEDALAKAESERDAAQQAAAAARNAQTEAERRLAIAEGRVAAESAAATATRAGMLAIAMDGIIQDGMDNHIPSGEPSDPPTKYDDLGDSTTSPPTLSDIYPGETKMVDDAPMPRTGLAFTRTGGDGVMIYNINDTLVEFQEYEIADAMAPAIAGWESVTLSRRNDADTATQTIHSYTDIAPETFLEKYSADLTAGALTVDAEIFAQAASSNFPTWAEPSVTFTGVSTSPAFAGTYDGVPGEFQCSSSDDCVVMADPTGTPSIVGAGQFTFTPDDLTTLVPKVDSDYLYFGYWLHKPDAPGGDHRFSLIAGGSDMFTVRGNDNPRTPDNTDPYSIVHTLAGEARYSGPAAGKYVTRSVIPNTAEIGQFTATVDLIVDFGTATTAGDVDGVVRDFMEGGASLGNWRVTLMHASLAQIGAAEHSAAGTANDPMGMLVGRTAIGESMTQFTGMTEARIGASSASGRWVGTFHGNDRKDGKPEAIVGMFEANAEHAAISGAFGVKNTAQ